MNQKIKNSLGIIMFFLACMACSESEGTPSLSGILEAQGVNPNDAALLIVRLRDGRTWSHGDTRLDEQFVAASTSKIPHTFIALESGRFSGPETAFQWDGTERWAASWNQDQTLATAYARSAVWVYQEIAESLGHKRMTTGLEALNYGNRDTGEPEDVSTYWLNGPLKISAREQVQFLSNLRREQFRLSPTTYAEGKSIMMAGRSDGRFAKTGWYFSEQEVDIGWYVGWHEVDSTSEHETYVFAFNMDVKDRESDPPKRVKVVDAALDVILAGEE